MQALLSAENGKMKKLNKKRTASSYTTMLFIILLPKVERNSLFAVVLTTPVMVHLGPFANKEQGN